MTSSLARKFAVVGIAVGITSVLLWWYVKIFNPFHLPTMEQAMERVPPNYSAPLLFTVINYSVFVLCPGTLLMFFAMDMRGWFSWFMWVFAVLLNGPIYYAIGFEIEARLKRRNDKNAIAK
jgi:hypothetical protein